ncbi:MAG: hypothetical protein ACR2NJ_08865, partial [Acidimicrobiales bacterium]
MRVLIVLSHLAIMAHPARKCRIRDSERFICAGQVDPVCFDAADPNDGSGAPAKVTAANKSLE